MPNVLTPIKIRNEEHLSKEVLRGLRFIKIQLKKGWNVKEVMQQTENLYGERIFYFILLSLKKSL